MLFTSSDDGYGQVLPEFVTYGSANRSDSKEPSCGRLSVAKSTVRTSFDSSFLTVRFPMAYVEVACSARSLVVRALVMVLDSARLLAGMQTTSALSVTRSSSYFCVAWQIFMAGDLE